MSKLKIAFVHNMCTHYRIGAFERLSKLYDVDFYFFSDGKEKHFLTEGGVHGGSFNYLYLRGVSLFGQRIAPSIICHLMKKKYDVIIKCTNGKFMLPLTFIIAKLLHKPFILWHTFWYDRNTFLHKKIALPIYKFIWRYSDAIVTYGKHGTQYLIQHGVESKKIFEAWQSVDNFIYSKKANDDELKNLKKSLNIENQKVVLYVGRIEAEKGLEYLIEAFSKINNAKAVLVFVGTGKDIERYKKLCIDKGIESKTRFVGYVVYTELYLYYSIADLFVLPSATTDYFKEPWGLVVNEAMNQGLPVIVTEAVGAAVGGLVLHEVNGFVIRERNAQDIADSIEALLTNRLLWETMSQASKDTIKKWDYVKMVSGFTNALEWVRK